MSAARLVVTVLVGLAAVLGGFYQLSLKPKLVVLGEGRVVEPVGNSDCKTYAEAQACESALSSLLIDITYDMWTDRDT